MNKDFYLCGTNDYDDRFVSKRKQLRQSEGWIVGMGVLGGANWMLKLGGKTPT